MTKTFCDKCRGLIHGQVYHLTTRRIHRHTNTYALCCHCYEQLEKRLRQEAA